MDESAVKMVYKQRSKRLNTRVKIADRCLALAILGIFCMVFDNELCGQHLFAITKVFSFKNVDQLKNSATPNIVDFSHVCCRLDWSLTDRNCALSLERSYGESFKLLGLN